MGVKKRCTKYAKKCRQYQRRCLIQASRSAMIRKTIKTEKSYRLIHNLVCKKQHKKNLHKHKQTRIFVVLIRQKNGKSLPQSGSGEMADAPS